MIKELIQKQLNEINEKLEEVIADLQEIFQKNQEENEKPNGYLNCKRDACAYGLGNPCEKHELILKRQKREEKLIREKMWNYKEQREKLEQELREMKIQAPPK